MTGISHFTNLAQRRQASEYRFISTPDRMGDLRRCYRLMRRHGMRRHNARYIIVTALAAGRFGDMTWIQRRDAA